MRGTTVAVYTVPDLCARLAAHPAQWVGRAIRLRAVAVALPLWGTPGRALTRRLVTRLVDAGGGGSLPVVLGPQDRLLATLRGLPVARVLVPAPQVLVWQRPTVYRVQLEALHGPGGDIYEAVLLDAGQQDT
jgi:hypothetical protein